MITIKSWCIKIQKDGQPVIITESNGVVPCERLLPANEDVTVTDNGLVIKYKDKELFCSFDKVKYKNIPTPLQRQIDNGIVKITDKHILHLFYEIFSGVLIDRCPVVVLKKSFDLSKILEKYLPQFEDKIEGINFNTIINVLSKE